MTKSFGLDLILGSNERSLKKKLLASQVHFKYVSFVICTYIQCKIEVPRGGRNSKGP